MAVYWLTPIYNLEPLTFGAGRVCLPAGPGVEAFRQRLYAHHPRLLPMVKAAILPTDGEDEQDGTVCGEGPDPDWSRAGDIRMDGKPYVLSSCGKAFLDRMLEAGEQLDLLLSLPEGASTTARCTPEEKEWLRMMEEWARQGRPFLLIKEE